MNPGVIATGLKSYKLRHLRSVVARTLSYGRLHFRPSALSFHLSQLRHCAPFAEGQPFDTAIAEENPPAAKCGLNCSALQFNLLAVALWTSDRALVFLFGDSILPNPTWRSTAVMWTTLLRRHVDNSPQKGSGDHVRDLSSLMPVDMNVGIITRHASRKVVENGAPLCLERRSGSSASDLARKFFRTFTLSTPI